MKGRIIVLMFILVVLLSQNHLGFASQFNSVSFTYGYIYGSVEFPEEAHPTDTITCNLTVTAYIDVTIFNLTLAISGLVGENWQTLGKEQILSYAMAMGDNLSRQVMVTLPQNVSERLHYVIEASTDKGFGDTSFYATYVRTINYDALLNLYNNLLVNYTELQADFLTNYTNLQNDYNQLSANYSDLNATHNSLLSNYSVLNARYDSLNFSYESLNASYTSLLSTYNSLHDSYTYIKSKYDGSTGELNIVRILMFIFGISTAILAATTFYFRKKAPYIVLRKETAVKPEKE